LEKGSQDYLASRLPNELDEHDRYANHRALLEGTRVLSAYNLPTGDKLWVITEWDRSLTTLLLPEEY